MTAAAEEGADKVAPRRTDPATNPDGLAVRAVGHPPVPPASPRSRRVAGSDPRRRGLPSGFASIRDIVSFIAGVAVIAHEVWWSSGHPEVAILSVGVALAGLPVVFGADEKKPPPPPQEPAP